MRYLLDEQRKQVGFEYIINKLNVNSPFGVDEVRNINVFKDSDKINYELDLVEETVKQLNDFSDEFNEIEKVFMVMKDIRNSLKKCSGSSSATLDEVELFEIKMFSIAVSNLIHFYEKTNKIKDIDFFSLNPLITLLDPDNNNIPTFYIYDSYSDELRKIREQKKSIEQRIFVVDDDVELENLKKQRLEFVILEEEEELKIKKHLTTQIRLHNVALDENIKLIGKLDFLVAKAKLFIKENAIRPTIVPNNNIDIKIVDGINLEIKDVVESKGKNFTPVSIHLNKGVTIITGANMGGKSVSLKTIVQNLLLAQMGFYVFAKEAVLPQLDFIFYISDDMQSISKGLSTFGAEIVKMKPVIELVKRCNGFVALDEFARGTNPQEGSIIVKSLTEYLNDFGTSTVISTHYDGIVNDSIVHYQVIGLRNLDFSGLKYKIDLNKGKSVEIIQQHMDYRLEKVSNVSEVPKDALHVAELLGFEKEILEIAKKMYWFSEVNNFWIFNKTKSFWFN